MLYSNYNFKPFRCKLRQLYADLDLNTDTKVLYLVYY